jgi:hypothetical protein
VAEDLPDPQLNWSGFESQLEDILKNTPQIWDPMRNRRREWFSVKKMRKDYSKNGGGCAIM